MSNIDSTVFLDLTIHILYKYCTHNIIHIIYSYRGMLHIDIKVYLTKVAVTIILDVANPSLSFIGCADSILGLNIHVHTKPQYFTY